MTREQGYRLYYLIFEAEDEHAGQIYYGPAQGMIHTIPFRQPNNTTFEYDSIYLGEIPEFSYHNSKYDRLDNKETTKDLNEFSDLLENQYINFIQFLDTNIGKHAFLHILAHNNFMKDVYQKRLSSWVKFMKIYLNKSIPVEEALESLNITWPSSEMKIILDDIFSVSEYDKMFGKEYLNLEKLLFDEDGFAHGSMIVVANIIEEAFRVNKKYNSFKQRVIKTLSSSISFDTETPWEASTNNNFEILLQKMEEMQENHFKQNDMLLKINTNLEESRFANHNEHKELLNLHNKPEGKPFRLGVELGVFVRGDEKDPRYIIIGPTQTAFTKWLKYLIKQGYETTDLPTASTIRNRLRREKCSNDITEENASIESALNIVKTKLKYLE